MLTEAVVASLPAAMGVALSPVPAVTVVRMLGSERARTQGPAFAFGWVVALTTVSVLIGSIVGSGPSASLARPTSGRHSLG